MEEVHLADQGSSKVVVLSVQGSCRKKGGIECPAAALEPLINANLNFIQGLVLMAYLK